VDDFRLALNAFEQIDGVSIFSNPKIIVANEETANVDMTTKEPNVEVDFQAATQVGMRDSVSTKLGLIPGKIEPFVGEAFFSYGITLKVTPRISPSGMITVDIIPSISELDSYYRPSGLDADQPVARYPIIKMQRMETTFTMASGTTAVIGGLTKTSEGNVESGIPLLRNLPWIGPRLFGWKGRDKLQKEIVIFVTVGLAEPVDMQEDIGMPKNAVLSRDVLSGKIKEPGDRTIEEILSLKDPQSPRARRDAAVTEQDSEAAAPAAAPDTVEKTNP
jgi:type II secretory pathway component GspD/PulD (secretin)